MLLRVLWGSLRRRSSQLALIAAAVAVAAATVATLAGFSARVRDRLAEDLAPFGPNLVVRPEVGGPAHLPVAELAAVERLPGVAWARGVALAGGPGGPALERIEVRAAPARLGEVARAVEARVAGAEARPLRRVAESDALLGRRVALLLAAVCGVALLSALLAVAAAATALLGERRREVGLLFALGYETRRVAALFAGELLAAALVAALLGALLGEAAAAGLAARLLGAPAAHSPTAAGLAAAAATAVLVVGGALAVALRRLARTDTARVLQGL